MSAPKRIAVVAKNGSEEAARTASELVDWLSRRGAMAIPDEATAAFRGHLAARRGAVVAGPPETFRRDGQYDIAVVLGGDGTLLQVARSLAGGPPILGVNMGRLGFLTEVSRAELYPAMLLVLDGRYQVEERTLFSVEHQSARREPSRYLVLNDAVIAKSALARILELTLRIDGQLVARYRSDGLIVSTPTGSTAYNLSAGGPIVHPSVDALVLTPIAPHALTNRPLVLPAGISIVLSPVIEPQSDVVLTFDGQYGVSLEAGDVVEVTRAPRVLRLVHISSRTHFDMLRQKLKWGD